MTRLKNWKFKKDSILNTYTQHTPCNKIYQALCNELGEYYKDLGFRYAKSGPRLTKKVDDLKLVIDFWSSGSNTPGKFVNLEILPGFQSSTLETSSTNKYQFFWGTSALYKYIDCEPDCDVVVIKAFGETIKRKDDNYKNRLIISNNINIYGINENNFIKLVEFIDEHIISLFDTLKNERLLEQHLLGLDKSIKKNILNGREKIDQYIKINFPELFEKIDTILAEN